MRGYSHIHLSTLSLPRSRTTGLTQRTPSLRSRPGKASFGSGRKTYWTSSRKKAQRSRLSSSVAFRTILDNGYPWNRSRRPQRPRYNQPHSLTRDARAYDMLPGMHLRMGPGSRGWQRTPFLTRLERRLCRMVHIQIPELWTRGDRGIISSREVEWNRNAQVSHRRSGRSHFLLSPMTQIRRLVGTNRRHPIPDGSYVLSYSRCPRVPAVESGRLDSRFASGIVANLQESGDDGPTSRTV